jgi:hypothetical protein
LLYSSLSIQNFAVNKFVLLFYESFEIHHLSSVVSLCLSFIRIFKCVNKKILDRIFVANSPHCSVRCLYSTENVVFAKMPLKTYFIICTLVVIFNNSLKTSVNSQKNYYPILFWHSAGKTWRLEEILIFNS